jgi:hypothetical protein
MWVGGVGQTEIPSINQMTYTSLRESDVYINHMGIGSKILASIAVLSGTLVFFALLFFDSSFRSFFWHLAGQNILFASVGVVGVSAGVIAIGHWLWNR